MFCVQGYNRSVCLISPVLLAISTNFARRGVQVVDDISDLPVITVQLMTHRVVANVVPDEDEPVASARDLVRRQSRWVALSFVLVLTCDNDYDREAHDKRYKVPEQQGCPPDGECSLSHEARVGYHRGGHKSEHTPTPRYASCDGKDVTGKSGHCQLDNVPMFLNNKQTRPTSDVV